MKTKVYCITRSIYSVEESLINISKCLLYTDFILRTCYVPNKVPNNYFVEYSYKNIILDIKDLIIQVYKVASIKAVICTNFVVVVYYAFYKDVNLHTATVLPLFVHFYNKEVLTTFFYNERE